MECDIIIVMIMVNIHVVKARLSEYLEAAMKGEEVVICKRNQPVVALRAIAQKRSEPRPLGLASGMVTVPDAFFEPMPDDWMQELEQTPVFPAVPARASRVAKAPAVSGAPKPSRGRKRK